MNNKRTVNIYLGLIYGILLLNIRFQSNCMFVVGSLVAIHLVFTTKKGFFNYLLLFTILFICLLNVNIPIDLIK